MSITIITHPGTGVNDGGHFHADLHIENVQNYMENVQKGGQLEKMRGKKVEALSMAQRLRSLGYIERAARMSLCGQEVIMEYCPNCGRQHIISSNFCRDKICPVCGWRLSLRRFAELCTVMSKLQADLDWSGITAQHLTVTIRNPKPWGLADTLDRMQRAHTNMLKRRPARKMLLGWAKTLEITYNADAGTFHPHYHYILLSKAGLEWDEAAWTQAWRDAAELPYNPRVRCTMIANRNASTEERADAIVDAVAEVAKYHIKPGALDTMPLNHLRALIEALHGRRMVGYSGAIRLARQQLGMIDEEGLGDEEEARQAACSCGAAMATAIARWQWGAQEYRIEEVYNDAQCDDT